MAGGFSSASVGTGLLDSLNNQYEQAQKNKQYGDEQQIAQFQAAAKQYDAEKANQTTMKNQIEGYANDLASSGNNGQGYAISPSARIVAKSAIDQGIYNKPEYHDYIMDAYEKTHADELANPKKYNIDIPTPTIYDRDSNPQQTAALSKFGINPGLQQLEQIRNRDVAHPLAGEPGAKFGNMNDFVNSQAKNKSEATATGKTEAAMSPEGQELMSLKQKMQAQGALAAYGYNPDGTPAQQGSDQAHSGAGNGQAQPTAQNPVQQPTPTTSAGAAPPQAGMPNASSGGINISGSAPPDQQGGIGTPASTLQQPGAATAPQAPATSPTSQGAQNNAAAPISGQAKPLSQVSQYLKDTHPTAPHMQERNWAALDNLTPTDRNLVLGMSEGDFAVPTLSSMRGAAAQHNMMLLGTLKDFDPSANGQRFKARDNFLNNPAQAGTITAINTAMSHVGNLRQAYEAMQNGDTPAFNAIANSYAQQLGKPAPTDFNGVKGYVSEELRKIYSNAQGGSLEELNQIADTLDKNNSPAQAHGMFREVGNLLDGKTNALNSQYQRAMGLAYRPQDWLDPEAKKSLSEIKSYNAKGEPVDTNEQPINPAAIQMLKANPQLAPAFEKQFGRPASAFLGG